MAEVFSRYTLHEFIGKGGMAEVYRATANNGPLVGHQLAIKRILPEYIDNTEYTDLFIGEADLTRQLKHPAIIPVLETGIFEGRYYIVMEYISGLDLEKILYYCQELKFTLPIDFCCFIAYTIASALSYAHKAVSPNGTPLNIVHCDVTPANIFISDNGDIFLGDFGVSQSIGRIHLQEQAVMGKASYMSPEQIMGQQVIPATDIFALGSIFYKLLTGQSAYQGKNVDAIWDAVMAGKHIPANKIRSDISPELNTVIEKTIAPELPGTGLKGWIQHSLFPNKVTRYIDAQNMVDDLENLFDHSLGDPMAIASVVLGIKHVLEKRSAEK